MSSESPAPPLALPLADAVSPDVASPDADVDADAPSPAPDPASATTTATTPVLAPIQGETTSPVPAASSNQPPSQPQAQPESKLESPSQPQTSPKPTPAAPAPAPAPAPPATQPDIIEIIDIPPPPKPTRKSTAHSKSHKSTSTRRRPTTTVLGWMASSKPPTKKKKKSRPFIPPPPPPGFNTLRQPFNPGAAPPPPPPGWPSFRTGPGPPPPPPGWNTRVQVNSSPTTTGTRISSVKTAASKRPKFGWHHILIIVNFLSILGFSMLLAGCSSANGLRGIYLLSLKYADPVQEGDGLAGIESFEYGELMVNGNVSEVVRGLVEPEIVRVSEITVGFTALCVKLTTEPWVCGGGLGELTAGLRETEGDPLNLVYLAENFRVGILWFGLTIAAAVLAFISSLLLAFNQPAASSNFFVAGSDTSASVVDRRPKDRRRIALANLAVLFFGTLFALASAIWQHMASASASKLMDVLLYGAIETGVGTTAMVLAWIGTLLLGVSFLGAILVELSISILQDLADGMNGTVTSSSSSGWA